VARKKSETPLIVYALRWCVCNGNIY